jgi:Fe-S cluster biogenesis protein NfuA
MRDKVEAALNNIRPPLQADGGDLHLADVTEIIAVPILGGSPDYLAWIAREVT